MIEIRDHSIIISVNTRIGTKFLRIDETNFQNEERYLVLIDLKKIKGSKLYFKDYFEKNPLDKCIYYEYSQMKEKIERCVKSFQESESNPIPVSNVEYNAGKLSFTDGTTRYGWLIAAEAEYIPVECSTSSYKDLFKDYGYEGIQPKSVKELLMSKNQVLPSI